MSYYDPVRMTSIETVNVVIGGRNVGKTYSAKTTALLKMQDELKELQEKVRRLDSTIKACRLQYRKDISLDDLHLLEEQYMHMIKYEAVLKIRISRMESEVKGFYGYADTDSAKEMVNENEN